MRTRSLLLALLVASWPTAAIGSHATVPDDFATIPAAIASGADTVFVRDGDYPAAITIPRKLVLMPLPPGGGSTLLPYPSVGAITIDDPVSIGDQVHVQHMRVQGAVSWNTLTGKPALVSFDGCRLDQGLTANATSAIVTLRLHGCIIRGDVFAYLYYPDVVGCTFLGSSLRVLSHGTARIRDNYFTGPAPYAVRMSASDATWDVTRNLIVGTTIGIWAEAGVAEGNEIRDVTGTGLLGDGASGRARFFGNTIVRPGGHGIELTNVGGHLYGHIARGNVVTDAGGDGIHADTPEGIRENEVLRAAGDGIEISGTGFCNANRVLASAGRGIVATSVWQVDSNVVGRSGADGIRVSDVPEVEHNTSYLNTGDGFDVTGAGTSAAWNIGYANVQLGLRCATVPGVTLACNDWFLNAAGAVSTCLIGGTDLAVDPRFCDVPNDDVSLAATSPLLNAADCGRIGALGPGCASPVAVAGGGDPLRLAARPRPSRGGVSFAFPGGESPRRLTVFDVTGAVRWSADIAAGARSLEWSGADADGRPLPAGVYFARMRDPRGDFETRIVLVR